MASSSSPLNPKENIVPFPLQNPELVPDHNVMDPDVFKANLPSGIEVIVKLPLVEDSKRPLFCVSQLPRRYNAYAHDSAWILNPENDRDGTAAIMAHILTHPVYLTELYADSPVEIIDKGFVHPNDYALSSYTSVSGGVGLTFHISSNTDAKGKLRFVPYTNLTRSLEPIPHDRMEFGPYDSKLNRTNLIFQHHGWNFNQPFFRETGALFGVQTLDISLNRTALIPSTIPISQTSTVNSIPQMDLPFNTHHYWRNFFNLSQFPDPWKDNTFEILSYLKSYNLSWSIFQDSGVAVFLEGDLTTSGTSGSLNINIDFDYSGVEYSNYFMPLLPSVGYPGYEAPFMNLTKSYVHRDSKLSDSVFV